MRSLLLACVRLSTNAEEARSFVCKVSSSLPESCSSLGGRFMRGHSSPPLVVQHRDASKGATNKPLHQSCEMPKLLLDGSLSFKYLLKCAVSRVIKIAAAQAEKIMGAVTAASPAYLRRLLYLSTAASIGLPPQPLRYDANMAGLARGTPWASCSSPDRGAETCSRSPRESSSCSAGLPCGLSRTSPF